MKEIKAYVRRDCVNQAVRELQRAGAPGVMIGEIHPVGYDYEPNYFAIRFEDALSRYGYLRIVKLEVICADHETERLVDVIRKECHTGGKDDGMIFVSDVSDAVRIRDGACGATALGGNHAGLNRPHSEAEAVILDDRVSRK
jgi:nitrogen regulatory protein PII